MQCNYTMCAMRCFAQRSASGRYLDGSCLQVLARVAATVTLVLRATPGTATIRPVLHDCNKELNPSRVQDS